MAPFRFCIVGFTLVLLTAGCSPRLGAQENDAAVEVAGFEEFRVPAGRLEDGVLRITLEARRALWQPWGPEGATLPAHVWAVPGEPAKVPAPLIRVQAGTPVHVTLRNTLGDTVILRGLRDRGMAPLPNPVFAPYVGDSAVVAPGGTTEVRWTPTVPGTFHYFGRALPPGWSAAPPPLFGLNGPDRGLTGALIVDPAGVEAPPGERIFLITAWMDRDIPASFDPVARFMINGRSWPHTERLDYVRGDTVRWRVINETGRDHPMHLHGFYFRVDARGTQIREDVYAPEDRRLAVTETLQPSRTMRITWVPQEPGNWIFHCHFMRHMSMLQTAGLETDASAHDHGEPPAGEDLMGGLVLGITVRPGPEQASAPEPIRRRLVLHVTRRDGVFGNEAGYGFVVQEGSDPPAADSVRFPGTPIVLTRGEPTQITVRNRADVPLGVHWHGLELESWADGVPGWSGAPRSTRPAVAPGDSFVVRMTPPRSGSFMYHVHSEPGHQLAQGLYGAFLVLEPGQPWDRESDRVFLLGSLGAGDDPPPAVNGQIVPDPLDLQAGTAYRLRFMHISPDDTKRVTLLAGEDPVEWRPVAKDGAELPMAHSRPTPADLRISVGETYDYSWTPSAPGEYTLRIVTTFDTGLAAFPRRAPPPDTTDIRVRVR